MRQCWSRGPHFNQLKPSRKSVVDGLQAAAGAQHFTGNLRVLKSGVYQQRALLIRGISGWVV